MSDDPKRRDRLSAALRENLRRRKAQARGRAEAAREGAADAPADGRASDDSGAWAGGAAAAGREE